MTHDKITLDKALPALEEVVAEAGGDFVYEMVGGSCVYYDQAEGKPSCGIGRALFRMGWTAEELIVMDNCGDLGSPASVAFKSLSGNVPWGDIPLIECDEGARQLLSTFQEGQDTGVSYGIALIRAKEAAKSVAPVQGSEDGGD